MSLILILLLIVLLLVLFITVIKINPFIAFLVVAVLAGWMLKIPFNQLTQSVQKGIGDMAGSTLIVLCSGAMIGKLVAESGAAQVISSTMIKIFGRKYIQWGMLFTGFIIGIPLFYNVGFVLVVPIIFTLVYEYKLPPVFVGLPMLASLSVAHGFLPPHPSPSALVSIFHADLARTLLLGLIAAVPAIILAGPVFSSSLKKIQPVGELPLVHHTTRPERFPGVLNSFFSALLPVFLLVITTVILHIFPEKTWMAQLSKFVSDPSVLMMVAVLINCFSLGVRYGKTIKQVMHIYEDAIKEIAILILIITCSGALKQVLIDSGASNQIAVFFQGIAVHPLVLSWIIAATIRVCLGSATVAGLTTAGIITPMMSSTHIDPSLMVLSIGSGSLMFSHINDPGFWMFKEYFNLSMKDTFRSWSLMETIVSVVGLASVMLLNALL
jgi:Gnt-I system high-affinity gluconate transporter